MHCQVSEECLHYFVVKTGHMWKAAGGKYCRQHVQINQQSVPTGRESWRGGQR